MIQIVGMVDKQEPYWGLELSLDVSECNPDLIRSATSIRQYVSHLIELIDMKAFGGTAVVNFGEDEKVAGFSMTQLIETSLISGHFADLTNTSYLNIFSCKEYDPQKVIDFTVKFFEGKLKKAVLNYR